MGRVTLSVGTAILVDYLVVDSLRHSWRASARGFHTTGARSASGLDFDAGRPRGFRLSDMPCWITHFSFSCTSQLFLFPSRQNSITFQALLYPTLRSALRFQSWPPGTRSTADSPHAAKVICVSISCHSPIPNGKFSWNAAPAKPNCLLVLQRQ